jgi:Domain of unknown function (DUF4387)
MNAARTVGDLAGLVRSKNAGPFWQTIDIFFATNEQYHAVADHPALDAEAIGRLYRVDPDTVHIYRLPGIRVVKISFPRSTTQGSRRERDMHGGQQHIPLCQLALIPTDHHPRVI